MYQILRRMSSYFFISFIFLVPGAAGSQLEARLDRDTVPHDFCPKKTDHWSNIWLNINSLLSNDRYCLEDNIK